MAAGAQAKKVVDSWKTKKWYTVIAPNFLNNIEAAYVPSFEDASLMNRIIEIPLKEITRDLNHMYTSIKLRIHEIKGKKAYTKFIGHSIAREFLRTMVRRRRDVVDVVFNTVSKDGIEFRVKIMAVTENHCSERQKTSLRKALIEQVNAKARAMAFGDFVREMVIGRGSQELYNNLGKIVPVKRVELWKTELKEEFDEQEKQAEAEKPAEAQATPA